jgi:hypothetical protein
MAASIFKHTPSGRPQLAIEPAPETSGAIGQMAGEGCHLLNLPVELQKMILEYVGTPITSLHLALEELTIPQLISNCDKKRACLVCKQFQLLATPLLYHYMYLPGMWLTARFRETLNKENLGLKHVRTLRITFGCASDAPKKAQLEDDATSVICRLLVIIPKHSLTRLEYGKQYIIPELIKKRN